MNTAATVDQIFEHVSAGGTGLTNFPAEHELVTQQAIDEWCAECLGIKDGKKPLYVGVQIPAYGPGGELIEIPDTRALRTRTAGVTPARMGEFFAIFTAFKLAHEAIERIRNRN